MSGKKDSTKSTYCVECGKEISNRVYPGGLCHGCYNYYLRGGTENEIPPKGVIAYDQRGYVVCHICGRAYVRLGSHVRESHNMLMKKYKKIYGLCANSRVLGTTSREYHNNMSKKSTNDKNIQRLIQAGRNTRLKSDNKLRKGKQISTQEKLAFCEKMQKWRNQNNE